MNPIVKAGGQRAIQKQIRGKKYPKVMKAGKTSKHPKKKIKKIIKKVKGYAND